MLVKRTHTATGRSAASMPSLTGCTKLDILHSFSAWFSLFKTLNLYSYQSSLHPRKCLNKNTVVNMPNQAYPNPALDMPPAYPGYAQNMPLPDPGYAQNVPPPHPGYAQNMPHTASSSKNIPAVDLSSESARTVCQNCFKEVISSAVDCSIYLHSAFIIVFSDFHKS